MFGIFHLGQYLWYSSMLLHISVFCSLLWLNNKSIDGHTTFYLSVHPLMDIWGCFCFSTAMNVHIQVFAPMSLFLLNRYLWVERLGQLVNLCLTSKETTIFQSGCTVSHLISNVSISPTLVIVIIVYLYFMPSFVSIWFYSLR